MTDVLWACAFVLTCLAFYRFALPALKRFDQANVARIEREARDKAAELVEPISFCVV